METPGHAPSAEAVPDTAGPDAAVLAGSGAGRPAPGTPAPGTPGTEASQAAPAWRFLIEPRWLAWHLFVVLAFWGMLWLGDWQLRRALAGNGLSWAYTFEWPLFAGFGLVFWARTIRDEFRLRRGVDATPAGDAAAPGPALPEGIGTRPAEQPDDDADDAELASYNAYLAKLNAEAKEHSKRLGSR